MAGVDVLELEHVTEDLPHLLGLGRSEQGVDPGDRHARQATTVAASGEVPTAIVEWVRGVCTSLPEVVEEEAWTGTRWVVRGRNFAHLVQIDGGWPPAYASAAGRDGPVTVLTFRTPTPELYERGDAGPSFFRPPWFPDIAGVVVDDGTDRDEIAELLVESYCVLAPKALVARLDRGDGA
jgi:hypothetical protein